MINFSNKIKTGLYYTTLFTVFARGLSLLSSIIVTKIIMPEDFGLLAISTSVITMAQGFTSLGFGSALIQQINSDEEHEHITWTIELFRHLLLFAVIFFSAPLISKFFDYNQSVGDVIRVSSFTVLIKAFQSISPILFRKDLDFKRLFRFELIPAVIRLIIVICLAIALKNIWAIIITDIVITFLKVLLSYLLHSYRPRVILRSNKTKSLFHFGKWVFITNIISKTQREGIVFFIGKFFGLTMLGIYNRAFTFSLLLVMQFAEIFWRVLYPALSLLQNNDKNFTRLLYLMAKSLNLIITFICVMIFILFDDFVLLFLGANWEPMIDIVKIFCVYCWSLSFIIPFQIAIQAMGAPKNLTIVNLINLIIIISTIVPASNYYGIQGVILAQIFSSSISLIFLYKSLRVISNIQIFKHLQLILASFIAASLSVFFNTHIYKLLVIPNNYFDVIIEVVVAISLFVVITLVLEYLFSKKSPRVLLNELYDLVFN